MNLIQKARFLITPFLLLVPSYSALAHDCSKESLSASLVEKNETALLVFYGDKKFEQEKHLAKIIETFNLNNSVKKVCLLSEAGGAYREYFYLLYNPEIEADLLAKFLESPIFKVVDKISSFSFIQDFNFEQPEAKSQALDILNSYQGSILDKIRVTSALKKNVSLKFNTAEDMNLLVKALIKTYRQIESFYEEVYLTSLRRVSAMNLNKNKTIKPNREEIEFDSEVFHPLYQKYGFTLRNELIDILQVILKIGGDDAQKIVLKTISPLNGVGLELMPEIITGRESFLDFWLKWFEKIMNEGLQIPAELKVEDYFGAGLFYYAHLSNYPALGIPFKNIFAGKQNLNAVFESEIDLADRGYPLYVLGLTRDATELKNKIIEFISEQDKKIQIQLLTENNKLTSKEMQFTGNEVMYRFLELLCHIPFSFKNKLLYGKRFHPEYYLENILDILNILVSTSDHSLFSEGTYLKILDTSFHLINLVNSYDLGSSQFQLAAKKMDLLQRSILKKITTSMSFLKRGSAYGCEIMLNPNPRKFSQ